MLQPGLGGPQALNTPLGGDLLSLCQLIPEGGRCHEMGEALEPEITWELQGLPFLAPTLASCHLTRPN